MKTNIKDSIYNFMFWFAAVLLFLLGLFISISQKIWVSAFYGVLSCLALLMLLDSIQNIQWFDVNKGCITIYSSFGVVKRVRLNQIQTAFKTNAAIFGIKGLQVKRAYLVLCLTKLVSKADIGNAYNRKKRNHIIIPYTIETAQMLQAEYQKYCNRELLLK